MKLKRMDSWGNLCCPNCKQTLSVVVFVPDDIMEPIIIDMKPDHDRFTTNVMTQMAVAIQKKM